MKLHLVSEEEQLDNCTGTDNCPCCNDEYSDRRCYCPPQCPDYEPGESP